jgi:hypothetical protein
MVLQTFYMRMVAPAMVSGGRATKHKNAHFLALSYIKHLSYLPFKGQAICLFWPCKNENLGHIGHESVTLRW